MQIFKEKINTEFFSIYRKLSLSTNMIEKVIGLNGMKNLRILSLGRNYIKSFTGLVMNKKKYRIPRIHLLFLFLLRKVLRRRSKNYGLVII